VDATVSRIVWCFGAGCQINLLLWQSSAIFNSPAAYCPIVTNKADTTFTQTRELTADDIHLTIVSAYENAVAAQVLEETVFYGTIFCAFEMYGRHACNRPVPAEKTLIRVHEDTLCMPKSQTLKPDITNRFLRRAFDDK